MDGLPIWAMVGIRDAAQRGNFRLRAGYKLTIFGYQPQNLENPNSSGPNPGANCDCWQGLWGRAFGHDDLSMILIYRRKLPFLWQVYRAFGTPEGPGINGPPGLLYRIRVKSLQNPSKFPFKHSITPTIVDATPTFQTLTGVFNLLIKN
jgi:hypothetical protein